MTAYTPKRATHQTLTAATLDTVTFSEPGKAVRVTNRDATQVIYFRIDHTAAVSAAADNYIVPAGVGNCVIVASKSGIPYLSLISSAGGAYSVESFPEIGSAAVSGSSGGGAVTNAGTFAVQDSQTKAEDVASANADALFPIGVVRRDSAASSSTTDGDWSTLNVDSTGRVWANVSNTVNVTETGTQVQVDDAAFTPATSKIAMSGYQADETATDSVDEGDGGAARMTLDRKQIVTQQGHTAGGLSVVQLNGSDGAGGVLTNAAQAIKASAGQLYGYYIYNPNVAATFVHFYNTAFGSVTVGTTNPLVSLTLPASSAANLMMPIGIAFGTAISAAATTTAGGNTAPSTGLDVTVFYA